MTSLIAELQHQLCGSHDEMQDMRNHITKLADYHQWAKRRADELEEDNQRGGRINSEMEADMRLRLISSDRRITAFTMRPMGYA